MIRVATLWQISVPAISVIAFGLWPHGQSLLEYQASTPLLHQWWVLLSAPLLHTNGYHLMMNVAAYGLIASLSSSSLHSWRMPVLTLWLGALSTLGFALFNQQLTSLVGLSGALHGIVAYLVIREFNSGPKFMLVLGAGLLIKLAWEQLFGASAHTASLINANVAVLSHLTGAIAGTLTGLIVAQGLAFKRATH